MSVMYKGGGWEGVERVVVGFVQELEHSGSQAACSATDRNSHNGPRL